MWDGVGKQLGGYTIEAAVGVGSTGTVWRAVQSDLGRRVAIKTLAPGVNADVLRAEAQLLATLDHPNIVRIYDFVEAGPDDPEDPAWLAEEWVDGERIDELVARLEGPLSGEQAVGVVRGALQGLAYAHERSVVHGDISPGNVLVDTAGTSRLIDFGLAGPSGSSGSAGTAAFCAPESVAGAPVTPASDVYSSAAVLRYLLGADAGGRIGEIIARATAEDPGERPRNASELLAELEEAARERYGMAWLARASIAGLAVAPAAAMGVEMAGAGASAAAAAGSAAAGEPPVAVVTTESAASTETAESADGDRSDRSPRRRLSRPAMAAAGAVVVVAGGVVAAVAATGGSDKKATVNAIGTAPSASTPHVTPQAGGTPAGGTQPAGSPTTPFDPAKARAQGQVTAAATAGVAESAQLPGSYTVSALVTASEISADPVGTRLPPSVWTISKGCAAGPCQIAISSSTGKSYAAAFNGKTLTFVYTDSTRNQCVDHGTQQPVPGVTALVTNVLRYRLDVIGLGSGGRLRLDGTAAATQSYSDPVGDCKLDPPRTETRKITATQR